MSKIVAYACSTRPNALWSAAQFNNALPKNRTECDIPLVAKADYDELLEVVKAFVVETVDYATLNKLGDPEQQHNVKWARAVIAKVEGRS